MTKKIIILHGWTYTTDKWEPLIGLLEKEGFLIEFPKIPALTAPIIQPWTIGDYEQWLKEIIVKESGKVILLGHSNGGRIAAYFAAHYPEKIAQLILIDCAGIYHDDLNTNLKRGFFSFLAKFGKRFTKSKQLEKLLYKFARESDYFQAEPNVKITMHNLITRDISEEFKQITVPTQLIWGEHDTITPLSDGRKINSLIKGSTLNIIANAKHSPFFTNPTEVCEIISKNI